MLIGEKGYEKVASSLIKALRLAALADGEIVDEIKKIDLKDYDPLELLMYWEIMVKGILYLTIIYPMPFMNE